MIVRKTTDEMGANSNAMLGLSGLDTASMLKSMMRPYKTPIQALSKKQQIVAWKQDRYRELITKLNDFKSKFFDYKNPATNIAAAGTWKKFLVENPGGEYVKISSTTDSRPKNGTIEMLSMPTASAITGRSGLVSSVEATRLATWTTAVGSYLTINMDGITRSVQITAAMAAQPTEADKVALLQNAIDSTFGADKLYVSLNASDFLVLTAHPTDVNQFIIVDGGISTARLELGFTNNLSNKVVLSDTLGALSDRMENSIGFINVLTYDSTGAPVYRDVVEFKINGVSFQFFKSDTIKSVMDTINGSGCGVKMAYNNAADRFTLTAETCGPGETIMVTEAKTGFFSAIGLGFLDEDAGTPDFIELIGGNINANLVDIINDHNDPLNPLALPISPQPHIFNVTINGVKRQIILSRDDYIDEDDLIGDVNAQLKLMFPSAGFSVGVEPPPGGIGAWKLKFIIDKSASNAAWSIQFDVDAASPVSAMGNFGLADMETKLLASSPTYVMGEFGKVIIDGVTLQIDRPVFETDGVLYELKKLPPPGSGPIEYTIRTDTDKIVELVRDFVDAYNEVVRAIGEALGEKRDFDYMPLTDEQKDQMTEKEIEKWEAKVKTGLLRGDTNFISLSSKLRLMVYNPVHEKYGDNKSIGISLKNMGIDTLNEAGFFNPTDNGALYINEEWLRYAIETNLDQIALLFTKTPEKYVPKSPDDDDKPEAWFARMQRMYDDHTGGLAVKFLNILDDYIRTTRGANNAKGVLIERAGIVKDTTELTNMFTRELFEYDRRINALWARYDRIEKQKLLTLSRLETIISNAANQMSWLQGQTNGG